MIDEKVDVVLTGVLGEGPFHVLRDNLVQIYYLPKNCWDLGGNSLSGSKLVREDGIADSKALK